MSLPPSMAVELTKKNYDALTSHGQNLLWGDTSKGFQGNTELTKNMRFQGNPRFQAASECAVVVAYVIRHINGSCNLFFVSQMNPTLRATIFQVRKGLLLQTT